MILKPQILDTALHFYLHIIQASFIKLRADNK